MCDTFRLYLVFQFAFQQARVDAALYGGLVEFADI